MALLEIDNLSKNFGGLRAVDNLCMEVRKGQIVGLIGPNGAGKTTIFNLISGILPYDGGDVVYEGTSLSHLRPHQVCRRGVSRTFQLVKPFADLSVLQNVMVGALLWVKDPALARTEAARILEFLGIGHLTKSKAGALTVSARKQLEIARALATQPKLLLLDEPLGGLNAAEIDQMIALIETIRERGITLLVIEHVMKAVMSVSDHIVVINYGEKIAEGTPTEVSSHKDVIAAYLGEEYLAS